MSNSTEKIKDLVQVVLLVLFLGFAIAVIVLGLWVGGMPADTSVPEEVAAILFVNAHLVSAAMIAVLIFLAILVVVAIIWAAENTPDLKNQDETRKFIKEHRVEGLVIILGLVVVAATLALAVLSGNTLYALIVVIETAIFAIALAAANTGQLIKE